jgi:hypothetical protein
VSEHIETLAALEDELAANARSRIRLLLANGGESGEYAVLEARAGALRSAISSARPKRDWDDDVPRLTRPAMR